jgi:hypothetical protein
VPFDWTETQRVKPLCTLRAETGDIGRFIGVALGGRAYPFETHWDEGRYLSTALERDGFVGFRVRREGVAGVTPSSFWIAQLGEETEPEHVQDDVIDFAMLPRGQCVFVTGGHGHRGTSTEAFVYRHATGTAWNPLQGVERLPPLDPKYADKDYIEDKMAVQLTPSFGSSTNDALVLCVFSHARGEMRAFREVPRKKPLERRRWRRALIVTSDGERFMTDLFREDMLLGRIWLHDSGRILVADGSGERSGGREEHKLHLSILTLDVRHTDGEPRVGKPQP